MKKTKRWTVRFKINDDYKYVTVIGADLLKVLEGVINEYGTESEAIEYASSEDVDIIE